MVSVMTSFQNLSSMGVFVEAEAFNPRSGTIRVFIDPDLPLFAGHFPGNPLLPGVVQLDCVVSAAALVFQELGEDRFAGLASLKFKAPVRPGDQVSIDFVRNTNGVAFTLSKDEAICTQGQLVYREDA